MVGARAPACQVVGAIGGLRAAYILKLDFQVEIDRGWPRLGAAPSLAGLRRRGVHDAVIGIKAGDVRTERVVDEGCRVTEVGTTAPSEQEVLLGQSNFGVDRIGNLWRKRTRFGV